jgi:N6-adenosine-specific RNA methylase IME4
MKIKTLVIDPPWMLCTGGSKTIAPQNYYSLQNQNSIKKTISEWLLDYQISTEAHIYIWSINSFSCGRSKGIIDALDLCHFLKFKPITLISWIKNQSIPTPYGQRQTEKIIFGSRHRKGFHKSVMYKGIDKNSTANKSLSKSVDFFYANRSKHSTKPEKFYEYVEQRSCGPYLELYARKKRKNWICLGDEI